MLYEVITSLMTAVSGAARSYVQLLVARIGVGVGEASFLPSAHSLIANVFPPDRRATAFAIFSVCKIYLQPHMLWRVSSLIPMENQ